MHTVPLSLGSHLQIYAEKKQVFIADEFKITRNKHLIFYQLEGRFLEHKCLIYKMGITLILSVEYLVFKFHTTIRTIIFHFAQLCFNIYKSKTLIL
jgi:hypothetical protein